MKPLITLFFVLIMVHLVIAIDCDYIEEKEICEDIKNSDLTEEEKEYLLQDIIDNLKNYPSHEYVRKWNLNIDTSTPPDNITIYENGYIKNAWIKILTVMPSVIENDTLYCSSKGEVLSAYNHGVELPTDTIGGDCRTEYILKQNQGNLNVSLNDKNIGSGNLVSFNTTKDPHFKAKYAVLVKTDILHYKYKTTCCKWGRKKCKRWCKKCEYHNTEEKTNHVEISDTFEATYYNVIPQTEFIVKDKYESTTKSILSGNNFTSLHLDLPNSYLKEYNYYYSTVWDTAPYNILTVQSEKKKRNEHYNLLYEGTNPYTIFVKNIKTCDITIYTHFTQENITCVMTLEGINITINTDKTVYKNNETIQIKIKPNKEFNITYANKTQQVIRSTTVTAQHPYNKISITYNDREYSRIIHVKNQKPFNLLFSFIIFFGINKAFIALMRKYWGC